MSESIDLQMLAIRESEQVEWKENVADVDNVVETLSAFANDLANLGGGYVVCGAAEAKDEHGFPKLVRTGLTASRFKEIEGKVLTRCRERVSPSLHPRVEELPAETSDRRILVFIMPATKRAHTFRHGTEGTKQYVRVSRNTIQARNGLLRELLVRKQDLEPWDRRGCAQATVQDLDLLILRDTLQQTGLFDPQVGVDPYLSDIQQLSPFVPPLCEKDPLSQTLRPRNFTVLLFGRNIQRFIPGAVAFFSAYPGVDRSEPHAQRHELAGTIIQQARRLISMLDEQTYIAFDKTNPDTPNAIKYPKRALHEAMINALAHRDYEIADPTRVTAFSDRIEFLSPGALPIGISEDAFREGRSGPKWRNQSLAWFFSRMQLAQAEGQGIPTILRVMKEEGSPAPNFELTANRVVCVLPAHPRHALAQKHRYIENKLSLGETGLAKKLAADTLEADPLGVRTVTLFLETHQTREDLPALRRFILTYEDEFDRLPASVLIQLAEIFVAHHQNAPDLDRDLVSPLLKLISQRNLDPSQAKRLADVSQRFAPPPEKGRRPRKPRSQ